MGVGAAVRRVLLTLTDHGHALFRITLGKSYQNKDFISLRMKHFVRKPREGEVIVN